MLLVILFVCLWGRSVGNVDAMYKVIKGYVSLTKDDTEQFEALFRYALPGYRCIQIQRSKTGIVGNGVQPLYMNYEAIHYAIAISDQSAFADYQLTKLYESMSVPPIMLGYFSEEDGCEGFIFLISSTRGFKLLHEYPLFAEHRFILIMPPVRTYKISTVNSKTIRESFGDSEVLIVTTSNLSLAFKLGQPDRDRFELVDNFTEPWEVEDTILDFHGRNIRALTYNCSFFSQIGSINEDMSANYTYGAEMDVFTDLANSLNLNVEWVALRDMPVHSIFFNTKKWYMQPITEQGTPKSVDVAFCGLTLSYKKMLSDLEMSEPLVLLCFQFLVPRPKVIQAQWNSIFRVFDVDVWATIGLAMLITAVILQRVTTYTRKFVHTEGINNYTKLGGSTLQLLSILVLAHVPPSTESQGASRHIISFWSFSAMILTTCFSSGLVSHLTSQQYAKKIDTIEELVENKFFWGFLYQPDFSELLNTKGNVMHARLKLRSVRMKSLEEHIKNLKKGNHFLWGSRIYDWFFMPEEELPDKILENFEVAGDCFIEYFLSFAFRQGSPYIPAFNQLISTYKETGLLKKEFTHKLFTHSIRKTYTYRVLELTGTTLSGGSLKLHHLTGIIEVWAIGMGIAIVVFILELFQKCHI